MSDSQDLKELVGASNTVEITDSMGVTSTITVPNMKIRQLSRVIELVEPVKDLLFKQKPAAKNPKPTVESLDVTTFLLKHCETAIKLTAEIIQPANDFTNEDWVGDLELDQMIKLVSKVLEVNLDFFILKVVPALSGALGDLNLGIHLKFLGGTIPSQSSSQPGTNAAS